jgi:DNA repair protein RecO (recombination protein O)
MIISEGIVLKERPVGEQDKFIDILTKESGVVEVSVKGGRKITGKTGSSTQLFAYSRFCMDKRGERLYLNSAEPIHIFYDLRASLTRLSLASYFAEVLRYCINPEAQSADVLRLFLNTLHFLEKDLRSEKQLRSIFELRLMAETGYMPDMVICRGCGVFEPEELFISTDDGSYYCADCYSGLDEAPEGNHMKIKLPVLNAVRHIVLTDFDRLFNFRLSDEAQEKLSLFTETYLTTHLERSFRTLEFYKSLLE